MTCEQGHQHWGLFGAAGVLAYAPDPGDPAGSLVLLQHRARWSHQGGTWALPGGAMDSDETPAEAALREADEECMLDPKLVVPRCMYSEEHGGWAYHTILAQAAGPFRVYSDAYESDEVLWLPTDQVDRLDLHPGFAASWPVLREALLPLTVFVDGTGIAGAPPASDNTAEPADAAGPLRTHLADLTRVGMTALPDGLAAPALARWYPDYVLVLDGAAGIAAADVPLSDGAGLASVTARFSWNQPLVVRTAEVRMVAVEDRAQVGDVLADLAGITPGRRLVVSDRPLVRDRAAAAGAGVADLDWLLGLLPPGSAPGLDS
ncbi:MAG TPA: NUDIX hydrolase [Streptosporangiaceae bacterium]